MVGVYDGLMVIEMADRRNQWAGKLLSDGGARVIQIEPLHGSPGRWCGPFVDDAPDPNCCIDYWWYNTGKESFAIDISRATGILLVKKLLDRADVFLDSASPGTLAALNIDYPSLASNVGLIHASLTDFGQDGPWRDYVMNDAAHLALGGQMASSGYSDPSTTPIGGQGRQAWHMGCAFALHGITVALFEREISGLGQYIDVSIHDACAIGTEAAVPQWMYYGSTMYRHTGMHANPNRLPPLQLPTADGKYIIAVMQNFGPRVWTQLIEWMDEKGVTGELHDAKYRDEAYRMSEYRTGNVIRDAVARLIAASNGEECFHRAQSHGISWGLVHAVEENYDAAHYQQRDYWRQIEHPEIGRSIPYPRGPIACDALNIEPRGRAPNLGENTEAIMMYDLDMSAEEISALRTTGAAR
tara:strand:- start:17016 stop:18254 length:1239 start_codon:yes stop_codon:yes gene_type:complete